MELLNQNPMNTKAWEKLHAHYLTHKNLSIKGLFGQDPMRGKNFSINWQDFTVDFSKNHITQTTRAYLIELANEMQLGMAIEKYFTGKTINATENRAVLHTALRSKEKEIFVNGENIVPQVQAVKAKMKDFCQTIISGKRKGYTGKAFTDVVNVGIGGSDLGPAMVSEALKFYKNHLNIHFVSNVDGDHLQEVIKHLNPETTLFIIVSKTFTTQETLTNALSIKNWFLKKAQEEDIAKHFVAVSTNLQKINEFGISSENVFPMWDWVGGRFSLWSAVGLTIALSVGYDNFEKLLDGANQMDIHFRETPFERNIPVQAAMLSIWYNNFFGAQTEAVIPYSQYLHRLPAYLQQGIMESNGKSVSRAGKKVNYQTGTIIWGETGTNSQHAFFQLIHQGTKLIPTDFIGFKHSLYGNTQTHDKLMSNFFAQTEALLMGKTEKEVLEEMGSPINKSLVPFKVFEGNKPTTTILIEKLTPESLGKLIAFYEHKIFVQGVIWNIYSFDQWGVELGKKLANRVLNDLSSDEIQPHDSSTTNLINIYKQ